MVGPMDFVVEENEEEEEEEEELEEEEEEEEEEELLLLLLLLLFAFALAFALAWSLSFFFLRFKTTRISSVTVTSSFSSTKSTRVCLFRLERLIDVPFVCEFFRTSN